MRSLAMLLALVAVGTACLAQDAELQSAGPTAPVSDLAAWRIDWSGHADGTVEASAGGLAIAAKYDPAVERPGHSRLTLTWLFDGPQDLSALTGIALRLRVEKPLDTDLWLHLLEDGGVRYRCNTFCKMGAVGERQSLLTRFDTDFAWDFESSQDPNQKLDLDSVIGLCLVLPVPEGGDGRLVVSEITGYVEPPAPTTNLLWIESEGGALKLLPPGSELPAPVSLQVTVGKLEEALTAPRLRWLATDAWGERVAGGEVEVKRAGEHSAPMDIAFEAPGYAQVVLILHDGGEPIRRRTFCLAALPLPAPEDATPREDSIFGIWPGGYGTWIKLGAKWARTYCQPWDFEPQPDGYQYVRKDKDGNLQSFPPQLDPELNHICFFRGMPEWLTSRPERADYQKFPPIDWDDYARFVRFYVEMMKDQIRVWEVWNEPVPYAYWMGSIEEVVKLHEVTYKAVHEVQPDAIVLGPCPYRIRLPFSEEFFRLGGGQWIDAVVTHAYMKQPDPDFLDDLQWLREVLEVNGLEKDIWITEVGWDTRTHTELEQAINLVKTYAIGLQERVHTIVWHMNWDYNDTMLRGGHGLLRNNHQPKPGLAVYATMIRTLEGAKPEGTLSGDARPEADDPAVVYQFRKDGRRIWLVWARKPCFWRPPCEKWEVRNLFGVPLAPTRDDPNAGPLFELTGTPIYGFELE